MKLARATLASPGKFIFSWLFVWAAMLWPFYAGAHELRPAIATIVFTGDGELSLGISLNLEAVIAEIEAGHKDTSESPAAAEYDRMRAMPPAELRAVFDRFAPRFLDRITLKSNQQPVPLRIVTVWIPVVGDTALPRISQLDLKGTAVPAGENLFWRVDERVGNSVIRLKDTASDKVRAAEYVIAGETSKPLPIKGLQRQSWTSVFVNYLKIGFLHIVPSGLDHMLFVIGLFLLSTHLGALLWQVTAFTVAHTVTLALGTMGIVQISPTVVEPLIAASIVYVAVENMATDRLHYWRPVAVFFFGLLHGLGFAGILRELGPESDGFVLSLFAFNLGVESGQIAVISGCFLVAGWALRRNWYRRIVVIPTSLAIAIVAAFWFVQRIGLV